MNSLRFFWKKFHLKQVKLKCIFSVRYYNWKVLSFYSDHWGRINSLDFFFLLFCFWCWNQTTSTKTNLSIKKKIKQFKHWKYWIHLKIWTKCGKFFLYCITSFFSLAAARSYFQFIPHLRHPSCTPPNIKCAANLMQFLKTI